MSGVGDKISSKNARWSFSGETSKNFDHHVEKSVPFYHEGHEIIKNISDHFLSNKSTCYELGCSTGTLLSLLANNNSDRSIKFIGVDNEIDMINVAKKNCKKFLNKIEFINCDLLDIKFEPADLIISYYTIQFIKPKYRQIIIDRIYKALNWGGAFLFFEKIRGPDARFQDLMTSLYNEFKLKNGYKNKEIFEKTRSLKGILEPFSEKGNLGLLNRAGFIDITSVMKYVCFKGYLAIK